MLTFLLLALLIDNSHGLREAQQRRQQTTVDPSEKVANTDWPAAWPPQVHESPHGPWPKRSNGTLTSSLESYTDENKRYAAPMFAQYPLIGSVTLPAGPMKGTKVPFPYTIQDGEGFGWLGTADASKVEAIMPKPWKPVLTTDGRATWATWKNVERVNFLGQVCQRMWVAFYAQHPNHSFPPVESPLQLLFGQFAGYHYYSYTHQMYDDCEIGVEIDRNMYGWDAHLANHSYVRDIHGNLVWNVTSGGEKVMDAKVYMPYGSDQLNKYLPQLQKYGMGPPLSQDPDQFFKFLKNRNLPFMFLSKPGVMPIEDSHHLTPVLHTTLSWFDTPTYPSTDGEQWENTLGYFERAYYDDNGPISIKMPFDGGDSITWYGEFAGLDMQIYNNFSLGFYTHHYSAVVEPPWTFTRVQDSHEQ